VNKIVQISLERVSIQVPHLKQNHSASAFGQSERLTIRLRKIIRNYSFDVGILKEFIQNADDAGASRLDVIVDWRQHVATLLPDSRMGVFMGPAMLLANDKPFSGDDLQAIQRIGESSKPADSLKTGRFGLGFNTAYNLTDYPAFLTGGRIYCFDPHRDAVAVGDGNGAAWSLQRLQESFPDWPRVFVDGGLSPEATHPPGTIFRLPFRAEKQAARSEISHTPITREAIAIVLSKAEHNGEEQRLIDQ